MRRFVAAGLPRWAMIDMNDCEYFMGTNPSTLLAGMTRLLGPSYWSLTHFCWDSNWIATHGGLPAGDASVITVGVTG